MVLLHEEEDGKRTLNNKVQRPHTSRNPKRHIHWWVCCCTVLGNAVKFRLLKFNNFFSFLWSSMLWSRVPKDTPQSISVTSYNMYALFLSMMMGFFLSRMFSWINTIPQRWFLWCKMSLGWFFEVSFLVVGATGYFNSIMCMCA